MQTLLQLRKVQEEHVALQHQHYAMRARTSGHVERLEAKNRQLAAQKQKLETDNAELTRSLATALEGEKEQNGQRESRQQRQRGEAPCAT